MAKNSENNSPSSNEDRLAALIQSVDRQVATPDQDFLEQLGESTRKTFLKAESDTPKNVNPVNVPDGNNKMIVYLVRTLAATVLGVAGWLWYQTALPPDPVGQNFGQVLDRMATLNVVHYELKRPDVEGELWSMPDRSRLDYGDSRFDLTIGQRTWAVDELNSKVELRHASYFRKTDQGQS